MENKFSLGNVSKVAFHGSTSNDVSNESNINSSTCGVHINTFSNVSSNELNKRNLHFDSSTFVSHENDVPSYFYNRNVITVTKEGSNSNISKLSCSQHLETIGSNYSCSSRNKRSSKTARTLKRLQRENEIKKSPAVNSAQNALNKILVTNPFKGNLYTYDQKFNLNYDLVDNMSYNRKNCIAVPKSICHTTRLFNYNALCYKLKETLEIWFDSDDVKCNIKETNKSDSIKSVNESNFSPESNNQTANSSLTVNEDICSNQSANSSLIEDIWSNKNVKIDLKNANNLNLCKNGKRESENELNVSSKLICVNDQNEVRSEINAENCTGLNFSENAFVQIILNDTNAENDIRPEYTNEKHEDSIGKRYEISKQTSCNIRSENKEQCNMNKENEPTSINLSTETPEKELEKVSPTTSNHNDKLNSLKDLKEDKFENNIEDGSCFVVSNNICNDISSFKNIPNTFENKISTENENDTSLMNGDDSLQCKSNGSTLTTDISSSGNHKDSEVNESCLTALKQVFTGNSSYVNNSCINTRFINTLSTLNENNLNTLDSSRTLHNDGYSSMVSECDKVKSIKNIGSNASNKVKNDSSSGTLSRISNIASIPYVSKGIRIGSLSIKMCISNCAENESSNIDNLCSDKTSNGSSVTEGVDSLNSVNVGNPWNVSITKRSKIVDIDKTDLSTPNILRKSACNKIFSSTSTVRNKIDTSSTANVSKNVLQDLNSVGIDNSSTSKSSDKTKSSIVSSKSKLENSIENDSCLVVLDNMCNESGSFETTPNTISIQQNLNSPNIPNETSEESNLNKCILNNKTQEISFQNKCTEVNKKSKVIQESIKSTNIKVQNTETVIKKNILTKPVKKVPKLFLLDIAENMNHDSTYNILYNKYGDKIAKSCKIKKIVKNDQDPNTLLIKVTPDETIKLHLPDKQNVNIESETNLKTALEINLTNDNNESTETINENKITTDNENDTSRMNGDDSLLCKSDKTSLTTDISLIHSYNGSEVNESSLTVVKYVPTNCSSDANNLCIDTKCINTLSTYTDKNLSTLDASTTLNNDSSMVSESDKVKRVETSAGISNASKRFKNDSSIGTLSQSISNIVSIPNTSKGLSIESTSINVNISNCAENERISNILQDSSSVASDKTKSSIVSILTKDKLEKNIENDKGSVVSNNMRNENGSFENIPNTISIQQNLNSKNIPNETSEESNPNKCILNNKTQEIIFRNKCTEINKKSKVIQGSTKSTNIKVRNTEALIKKKIFTKPVKKVPKLFLFDIAEKMNHDAAYNICYNKYGDKIAKSSKIKKIGKNHKDSNSHKVTPDEAINLHLPDKQNVKIESETDLNTALKINLTNDINESMQEINENKISTENENDTSRMNGDDSLLCKSDKTSLTTDISSIHSNNGSEVNESSFTVVKCVPTNCRPDGNNLCIDTKCINTLSTLNDKNSNTLDASTTLINDSSMVSENDKVKSVEINAGLSNASKKFKNDSSTGTLSQSISNIASIPNASKDLSIESSSINVSFSSCAENEINSNILHVTSSDNSSSDKTKSSIVSSLKKGKLENNTKDDKCSAISNNMHNENSSFENTISVQQNLNSENIVNEISEESNLNKCMLNNKTQEITFQNKSTEINKKSKVIQESTKSTNIKIRNTKALNKKKIATKPVKKVPKLFLVDIAEKTNRDATNNIHYNKYGDKIIKSSKIKKINKNDRDTNTTRDTNNKVTPDEVINLHLPDKQNVNIYSEKDLNTALKINLTNDINELMEVINENTNSTENENETSRTNGDDLLHCKSDESTSTTDISRIRSYNETAVNETPFRLKGVSSDSSSNANNSCINARCINTLSTRNENYSSALDTSTTLGNDSSMVSENDKVKNVEINPRISNASERFKNESIIGTLSQSVSNDNTGSIPNVSKGISIESTSNNMSVSNCAENEADSNIDNLTSDKTKSSISSSVTETTSKVDTLNSLNVGNAWNVSITKRLKNVDIDKTANTYASNILIKSICNKAVSSTSIVKNKVDTPSTVNVSKNVGNEWSVRIVKHSKSISTDPRIARADETKNICNKTYLKNTKARQNSKRSNSSSSDVFIDSDSNENCLNSEKKRKVIKKIGSTNHIVSTEMFNKSDLNSENIPKSSCNGNISDPNKDYNTGDTILTNGKSDINKTTCIIDMIKNINKIILNAPIRSTNCETYFSNNEETEKNASKTLCSKTTTLESVENTLVLDENIIIRTDRSYLVQKEIHNIGVNASKSDTNAEKVSIIPNKKSEINPLNIPSACQDIDNIIRIVDEDVVAVNAPKTNSKPTCALDENGVSNVHVPTKSNYNINERTDLVGKNNFMNVQHISKSVPPLSSNYITSVLNSSTFISNMYENCIITLSNTRVEYKVFAQYCKTAGLRVDTIQRYENKNRMRSFLLRQQFLTVLYPDLEFYRARRYIEVPNEWVSKALIYHLDLRRVPLENPFKLLKSPVRKLQDSHIFAVCVITDVPWNDTIPRKDSDFYIDYIIKLR